MRLRGWLILGMLAFPSLAAAQMVTKADVVGGWRAKLEHDSLGKAMGLGKMGWLVLWPDGLWAYGGALMYHNHGGARWRLVGDTLWLGNDYDPYFHPMIDVRTTRIQAKGYGLAVMDTDVINKRPPWPVPDSIYWSKAFRDSTTACVTATVCGTWVYKVSKKDQKLYLVRLDKLSRTTKGVAIKAVLQRDSLMHCDWLSCDGIPRQPQWARVTCNSSGSCTRLPSR